MFRIRLCLLRVLNQALVHRKLDSLGSRPCAQIVHPRLQTLLPPIKVHTRKLSQRRRLQMHVQALALADESPAVRSEVQDFLLADLPDGLVDRLDIIWDSGNVLHGTIVRNNHILHVIVPETEVHKFA